MWERNVPSAKYGFAGMLTLVLDEFSVEFFEDGRVMGSTIYPPRMQQDLPSP